MSRFVPGQVEVDKLRDITEQELRRDIFGAPPHDPLLGNYFQLPSRPERQDPVLLDDSLPTVTINFNSILLLSNLIKSYFYILKKSYNLWQVLPRKHYRHIYFYFTVTV